MPTKTWVASWIAAGKLMACAQSEPEVDIIHYWAEDVEVDKYVIPWKPRTKDDALAFALVEALYWAMPRAFRSSVLPVNFKTMLSDVIVFNDCSAQTPRMIVEWYERALVGVRVQGCDESHPNQKGDA